MSGSAPPPSRPTPLRSRLRSAIRCTTSTANGLPKPTPWRSARASCGTRGSASQPPTSLMMPSAERAPAWSFRQSRLLPLQPKPARGNSFLRGSCAMSFVPGFAPDALSKWRALDFALQELVLDELEQLANNPPATSEQIIDLVRDMADVRHYIFLHVLVDRERERIVAVGVGHHARSLKGR